jgi:hypothetical protein
MGHPLIRCGVKVLDSLRVKVFDEVLGVEELDLVQEIADQGSGADLFS